MRRAVYEASVISRVAPKFVNLLLLSRLPQAAQEITTTSIPRNLRFHLKNPNSSSIESPLVQEVVTRLAPSILPVSARMDFWS